MATTRRRSRPEGLWRALTQAHEFRGEGVAHSYPLFGPAHVVEGYPAARCWCEPTVEILEYGTLVRHHRAH